MGSMTLIRCLGFIASYSIFSAILWFITRLSPSFVIAISLSVTLIGVLLERWLSNPKKARSKSIIREFYNGFREFGSLLTTIVNSVLLLIVYFIGVGITSVIALLVGKHFLDMGKEVKWDELDLKKGKLEEYYRQF